MPEFGLRLLRHGLVGGRSADVHDLRLGRRLGCALQPGRDGSHRSERPGHLHREGWRNVRHVADDGRHLRRPGVCLVPRGLREQREAFRSPAGTGLQLRRSRVLGVLLHGGLGLRFPCCGHNQGSNFSGHATEVLRRPRNRLLCHRWRLRDRGVVGRRAEPCCGWRHFNDGLHGLLRQRPVDVLPHLLLRARARGRLGRVPGVQDHARAGGVDRGCTRFDVGTSQLRVRRHVRVGVHGLLLCHVWQRYVERNRDCVRADGHDLCNWPRFRR
mmetsp:Transcript_68454/g.222733  ORF Transcript_68454/g.222733 Transcript_68454/m.222733 type:complete len:271 (-) Transcript_68454:1412-2224(-)